MIANSMCFESAKGLWYRVKINCDIKRTFLGSDLLFELGVGDIVGRRFVPFFKAAKLSLWWCAPDHNSSLVQYVDVASPAEL